MHDTSSTRVALFRTHCALAQLQFAEANPGVLNWQEERIRAAVVEGASSLGLLSEEAHIGYMTIPARELAARILHKTQVGFPDLFPIAELAQAATIRLLYRGSAVEDEDVTEVMALELTAKLAADKLGVPDVAFMSWHRSQFAERANPQNVMSDLEALVAHTAPKQVFLSYRSDDTQLFVGRLADRLRAAGFGVFYDKEALLAGEHWKEELRHRISLSDAVIAIIGRLWLSERLFEEDDPVRMEIALALDLGKPMIPLLVNRAPMPADQDLPKDLKRLRKTHAAQVDAGTDFDHQFARLLDGLVQLVKKG
jgi:TIR domain